MMRGRKFNLYFGIVILITILAVAGCVYFGVKSARLEKENHGLKNNRTLSSEQVRIIDFGNQFVDEVLQANSEVDFDTRLKLENNVRDIGDNDILAEWQKFTESKTETDAQTETKNLLGLFFQKLQ